LASNGRENVVGRKLVHQLVNHVVRHEVMLPVLAVLDDAERLAVGERRMHPEPVMLLWFADRHRRQEFLGAGHFDKVLRKPQLCRVERVVGGNASDNAGGDGRGRCP
jgi:hypothetical protein